MSNKSHPISYSSHDICGIKQIEIPLTSGSRNIENSNKQSMNRLESEQTDDDRKHALVFDCVIVPIGLDVGKPILSMYSQSEYLRMHQKSDLLRGNKQVEDGNHSMTGEDVYLESTSQWHYRSYKDKLSIASLVSLPDMQSILFLTK